MQRTIAYWEMQNIHQMKKIPSNIFDDENKEYITYGDWLIDKMTSTYGEWKNFKKNLN